MGKNDLEDKQLINVSDVSLTFGGQKLFAGATLKFTPGNCYGIIGANGAGKSTFLKILSGELEPTTGEVTIPKDLRMSVLGQNQFQYDDKQVLETVILGNPRIHEIAEEKDALYAKPDFSDEDGIRASELEAEFAELGGWDAESDAAKLLQGLGIPEECHTLPMAELSGGDKVKVLLAQSLFGNPDIVLLDEPTNNLDIRSISWLEDFLLEFPGTLIVVSHDRHFLNTICTHIVDIDFSQVRMYVGNYDFWYESSKLMQRVLGDQKKKREDKIRELQNFIQRFSANKSKSKQATSRRKLLEKLSVEEMPASSPPLPLGELQAGPGGGQGHPGGGGPHQGHRWGAGTFQRHLPGEPGGQNRLYQQKRGRPNRPLPHFNGGAGAGLRHLPLGHHHQPELLPQGQHRLF